MSDRPVLLLGSVPLPTATDVFETAAARLDGLIRQIPDGETGDRLRWVGWQNDRMRLRDDLEIVAELDFGGPLAQKPALFGPKNGVDLASLDFSPLGYADVARASYSDFARLKREGRIGADVRFQVSLPTPLVISSFFPERGLQVLPTLTAAFRAEADEIVASIPHDDLSIQWDLARETQNEEARRHPGKDRLGRGSSSPPYEVGCEAVARISEPIPEDVRLGVHLCYGDPDGRHLIEPADTSVMVDIANDLFARVQRRIDYVHMPVPIERTDDAYFAPLDDLLLPAETQLYLGLVHPRDGIEGALRRIAAASSYVEGFGVATECGLGRRKPDDIPALLDLHREVATA